MGHIKQFVALHAAQLGNSVLHSVQVYVEGLKYWEIVHALDCP